jgi:hypothetical protein
VPWKRLCVRLKDWRTMLDQQPTLRRQIVSKLLTDKITLRPTTTDDGAPAYEVEANFTLGRFFQRILCPRGVASPMFASWNRIATWLRRIDGLRRAA